MINMTKMSDKVIMYMDLVSMELRLMGQVHGVAVMTFLGIL